MENKEGAEAPTVKLQTKDRELLINQFNTSGKIWEILPIKFNCDYSSNNCLDCSDGNTSITLCPDCDQVLIILDSGEPQGFTPFQILTEILDTDPIIWLINEGWINSTGTKDQTYIQQIGKVSYFSAPITNTYPAKEITVRELYDFICGEDLKVVTNELREIKKLDEKKYKLEKRKRLPSVTFSGTYTRRAGNKLKVLSDLMCFDIDHIADIANTKKTLKEDRSLGIVMMLTSPGADGIKLVLRSPHGTNYADAYQKIREYLKIKHNISTDSTQDIARACFLCHDPDAYFNEAALPTLLPIESLSISIDPLLKSEPYNETINKSSSAAPGIEKVEAYISALEAKGVDITVIYDEWVKLGFSFVVFGETGRSLFHRLSKIHPEYDFTETDKKYTNLLSTSSGRVSLGTFFYHCHKMNVRPAQVNSANYMATTFPTARSGKSQSKSSAVDTTNSGNGIQNNNPAPVEIDWEDVLRRHEIKPTDNIPIPPVAWKNGNVICGTLGEFSLLIGKAKSRKSFFVGLLVAGILNPDDPENPFSGELPEGKKKVIYIDTEQSKYHVQRAVNRIRTMIGDKVNSIELIVYALRPLSPKERMAAIDHAISTTSGLGLVVIDGIADLQTDINNPDQAVMVATMLLKWTEIHHIHIITVLHENKGDRNARGHLGTEMVNKAETTLSITKDSKNPNISIVEPEYCRSIPPATFAFEINENGLPVESLEYSMRKGGTVKADNLAEAAIAQIFKMVFAKNDNISYTSIWHAVKLAYNKLYSGNLPDNEAKRVVEKAKFDGIIFQEKNRGPYSLTKDKG